MPRQPAPEAIADLSEYRKYFDWHKPSWYTLGLCSQNHYKLYNKEGVTTIWFGSATEQRQAKIICAMCPVRWACLEENLDCSYGIFGGLSTIERKELKSRTIIRTKEVLQELVEND